MTIEQVERQKLTEQEVEEKDELMAEGFGEWKRRDLLVRSKQAFSYCCRSTAGRLACCSGYLTLLVRVSVVVRLAELRGWLCGAWLAQHFRDRC